MLYEYSMCYLTPREREKKKENIGMIKFMMSQEKRDGKK